jgi:hypothetical protein
MMRFTGTKKKQGDNKFFKDIVDSIFATADRAESEAIIEHYSRYWMDIVGTRGFKGEKVVSARPQYNALFETVDHATEDSVQLDEDFSPDQQARLDQLEHDTI